MNKRNYEWLLKTLFKQERTQNKAPTAGLT